MHGSSRANRALWRVRQCTVLESYWDFSHALRDRGPRVFHHETYSWKSRACFWSAFRKSVRRFDRRCGNKNFHLFHEWSSHVLVIWWLLFPLAAVLARARGFQIFKMSPLLRGRRRGACGYDSSSGRWEPEGVFHRLFHWFYLHYCGEVLPYLLFVFAFTHEMESEYDTQQRTCIDYGLSTLVLWIFRFVHVCRIEFVTCDWVFIQVMCG